MTIYEFERAKEIEKELNVINKNIEYLENLVYDPIPFGQKDFEFYLRGRDSRFGAYLTVDKKFLEQALEYYQNEAKKLESEFEALGKENNNG